MTKHKYWNNQKYYLNGNRWFRTKNPCIQLAHDVWNFYNPTSRIEKGDGNVIHHINKDSLDNRIENLQKMSRGKHTSFHLIGNGHGKSNKGKVLTKDHKENISKALLGKIFTKEHKENISKGHLGKKRGKYKK